MLPLIPSRLFLFYERNLCLTPQPVLLRDLDKAMFRSEEAGRLYDCQPLLRVMILQLLLFWLNIPVISVPNHISVSSYLFFFKVRCSMLDVKYFFISLPVLLSALPLLSSLQPKLFSLRPFGGSEALFLWLFVLSGLPFAADESFRGLPHQSS